MMKLIGNQACTSISKIRKREEETKKNEEKYIASSLCEFYLIFLLFVFARKKLIPYTKKEIICFRQQFHIIF